jgi:hypothetical protein
VVILSKPAIHPSPSPWAVGTGSPATPNLPGFHAGVAATSSPSAGPPAGGFGHQSPKGGKSGGSHGGSGFGGTAH